MMPSRLLLAMINDRRHWKMKKWVSMALSTESPPLTVCTEAVPL